MNLHRQLAVVFSVGEALDKVNHMRELGFLEKEIHLFAKYIDALKPLKLYTEMHVHQSGNVVDYMRAAMSGKKLHEACLNRFDFSEDELQHYGEMIRKGAIVVIAQHDNPVNMQPNNVRKSPFQKQLSGQTTPAQVAEKMNV